MIEVYAITDGGDLPLPGGTKLEQISQQGISGVFARTAERPPASAEALWRHERVVERLMAQRAVLPLRYGTVLADEWELQRVITERRDEFSTLLDLVRGRVELALRVLGENADGERAAGQSSSSGKAYMEALARRRRGVEDALAALAPLEEMAAAARKREAAGDATRLAFLVDRDRVQAFNARLDELRSERPELRMTCTGPWPPYSFVSGAR